MKIYLLVLISLLTLIKSVDANELATPLRYLYRFDEYQALISEVEKDGPIKIRTASLGSHASNAMWVPNERTIYLNISNKRSIGSLIRSIIFEMHNALTNRKFDYYDHLAYEGRLSRQKYIEAIEYLEYTNAVKTTEMLKRGIYRNILPQSAYWSIASSFNEHLRCQIQAGHSALIGQTYDTIVRNSKVFLVRK